MDTRALKVFEAIDSSKLGWDGFNRMCEDAPDVSTREKQLIALKNAVGASKFTEFANHPDLDLILSQWVSVEKESFIAALHGRIKLYADVSYEDFKCFLDEMLAK